MNICKRSKTMKARKIYLMICAVALAFGSASAIAHALTTC
jgi:hypothetical protein